MQSEPPSEIRGIFQASRQGLMLRGLTRRLSQGLQQLEKQHEHHGTALSELEQQHVELRSQLESRLREERRNVIAGFDDEEERLTRYYESSTLQALEARKELQEEVRRERRTERREIAKRTTERVRAAKERYAIEKQRPPREKQKQHSQLGTALQQSTNAIENIRALCLRRTGVVDPVAEPIRPDPPPPDIATAVRSLEAIARKLELLHDELRSHGSAALLESYRFILIMAVASALWAGGVWIAAPDLLVLWLLSSFPVGGLVGGLLYLTLSPRLRRMTRERYPDAERLLAEALGIHRAGKEIAEVNCKASLEQLAQQREQEIQQCKEDESRSLAELNKRLDTRLSEESDRLERQVEALDQEFRENIVTTESRLDAELPVLAQQQTNQHRQILEQQQREKRELIARHRDDDRRLAARVRGGVSRGLARIEHSLRSLREQHPPWPQLIKSGPSEQRVAPPIPIGTLRIDNRVNEFLHAFQRSQWGQSAGPARPDGEPTTPDKRQAGSAHGSITIPITITPGREAGLLLDCPEEQFSLARDVVRNVISRSLSTVTPGGLKLLMIDPLHRGETFAAFMPLADYDPSLVSHRVWTGRPQIETRLAELVHHMEDVLQTFLRDAYPTINRYNEAAGPLAEPYRAVAMFGLPAGLSQEAFESLRALIAGGPRCGIFVILVRDSNHPWPQQLAPLPTDNLLQLRIDKEGSVYHTHPDLLELPIELDAPPNGASLNNLLQQIGTGAQQAANVEVPFSEVVPESIETSGNADSAEGLDVPLGIQGVGRVLNLRLGEGVRQHVLIAGKTGSGKSTLLHTLILAGAMRYRPDQLQFYLLDFKKGVEFKPYADVPLPHARVVGIESEREFGLSVLKRLDEELQSRGEAFREVGAQTLAEYRRQSGRAMPRILLVVDEFQELFIRDDTLAGDCTMLLDRLVRQGRSFGIHVCLASQSLSGAYTLPRATLGQMAVRIALQSSEADAILILSEENTAARLLTRPGEAIFNDASGLIEGNQPFQVAMVGSQKHRDLVATLHRRDAELVESLPPPIIFAGNRPARWTPQVVSTLDENAEAEGVAGLLGEAVSLSPPIQAVFTPQTGRNLLITTAQHERARHVLSVLIPSLAARLQDAGRPLQLIYLDGQRQTESPVVTTLEQAGLDVTRVVPRDAEQTVVELAGQLDERMQRDAASSEAFTLLVVDPLERFRDLRQTDAFSFSSGEEQMTGAAALQSILRDGPPFFMHSILCCNSYETLNRWLPRTSHHDLELRLVGRTSTADSVALIDSPDAANLGGASMYLYDDADARLEKLRIFEPPTAEAISEWISGAFRDDS